MENATREVFGNVSPGMQVTFYVLILASLAVLLWRVVSRSRLWAQGEPGGFERDGRLWLRRLVVYALAQKRVHRKSLGGILHLLLFSGFVVLTIGTTLLFISHAGPVDFHHGWYYLIYELVMDVFGVAFCVGCALGLYRRMFRRPASLGHRPADLGLLSLLLVIGLTGFLLEALRLRYTPVEPEIAAWSAVGRAIELAALAGVDPGTAQSAHLAVWWLHVVLIAALFVTFPVGRLRHAITGPLNIALRPSRPAGVLEPVTMEQLEQSGRVGAGELGHFTRQQLLSLDACMQCGRCEDACPAHASGKPLSPKAVVCDLADLMTQTGARRAASDESSGDRSSAGATRSLHGETIQAETLWACTMCYACVEECPVLIGQVDLISDMRRYLVGEGHITGPPAAAMKRLPTQFNPYGQPNADRLAWADGLNVPTVETNPDFEYLLWVGCAASFDPRAQKVARATARLLTRAGVSFAVLGQQERCTGDVARRLGDEFLFQELAQTNIETLNQYKLARTDGNKDAARRRTIVTPCPHCLNTIQGEYPQFDGHYRVQHHSELLAELVEAGRLAPPAKSDRPLTLHDPCYLARVHGQTDAQRAVIGAHPPGGPTHNGFREMPRRGKNTFCCGAGGGRMWFEEAPDQRVSKLRAAEAVATGAATLATACPFCLNMMSDGMAGTPGGEHVEVRDIAEILLNE